jgi:flavin prenyltransferase
MNISDRIIVGISGASGVVYGVRTLQALRSLPVESHLVMSRPAEKTLDLEMDMTADEVRGLADVCHAPEDMAAGPSSGSFRALGMIIAPCSMNTVGEIANGITSSLLTRAATVTMKERRRLVLMARESPLHTVHLRNMLALSEMGAIIAPPVPAFYAKPESLDDMVNHSVGRVLDLFGLDTGSVHRWRE